MKLSELEPGLIEVGYQRMFTFSEDIVDMLEGEEVDKIHWYYNIGEKNIILVYEALNSEVLMFEPVKNAKDILNYHSAISFKKMSS